MRQRESTNSRQIIRAGQQIPLHYKISFKWTKDSGAILFAPLCSAQNREQYRRWNHGERTFGCHVTVI